MEPKKNVAASVSGGKVRWVSGDFRGKFQSTNELDSAEIDEILLGQPANFLRLSWIHGLYPLKMKPVS